jgi:hypothetical protein
MASLTDPELLCKFREALNEWNFDGFIQWKRRPAEWLRENLSNHTQKAVNRLMYEYVLGGGEIDETKENYEGYRDSHPYHYDFRVPIGGSVLYIETVFDELRMGPTITIVNMKYAN